MATALGSEEGIVGVGIRWGGWEVRQMRCIGEAACYMLFCFIQGA